MCSCRDSIKGRRRVKCSFRGKGRVRCSGRYMGKFRVQVRGRDRYRGRDRIIITGRGIDKGWGRRVRSRLMARSGGWVEVVVRLSVEIGVGVGT